MGTTRYLQRLGQSWYVRVKVPAALQARVGNTHIRRALGTRDLDEANRLKWSVVERIQSHLEALRRDHDGIFAPTDVLHRVNQVASSTPLTEPVAALAISPLKPSLPCRDGTLEVLREEWLRTADYIEQTKHQHRQACQEFQEFLGRSIKPEEVSRDVALTYVDERIKAAKRSYSTKRRKLNSLIAFWNWLGERRSVPLGHNPWKGFRLGKKSASKTRTRVKRAYRSEELVTLFSGRPRYPGLADVMALGLFTGARMEELCALRQGHIRQATDGAYFVSIVKSKTQAGIRTMAVTHPIASQLLSRRWSAKAVPTEPIFPELIPGGYDGKLSWGASKAFGRYRDAIGLSRETDFHSLRRTFITLLENAGVDQVRIARYVGHELPTLAFTVYSGGSTEQTMLSTANDVRYEVQVERAVSSFVHMGHATRRDRKSRS